MITNLGRIKIVPKGNWVAGTYKELDLVRFGTSSYLCVVASTTLDPNNATDWQIVATDGVQGIQGAQGVQGIQGTQGPQGATGNVPLGSAAPSEDGTANSGSSTNASREDHVHPSDTTKLSLSGGEMSGPLTSSSTISDASGNIRSIPQVVKTTSYTLDVNDTGKRISVTAGGVTVPANVFNNNETILIYNDSAAAQTITISPPVSAYLSGVNTLKSSLSLSSRGIASVMFYAPNACVISGNVT